MIREAAVSDAKTISEIIVKTWKTAYTGIISEDYINDMKTERYRKIIEVNIQNQVERILVYENGNKIYGFISGRECENQGEVIGLYVIPEKQNNGIGHILLSEMKNWFKENGYAEMILWTLNKAGNNVFYEKQKGEVFKRKDLEIGNKNYDGICYTFDL